jgi:hypothetical protein
VNTGISLVGKKVTTTLTLGSHRECHAIAVLNLTRVRITVRRLVLLLRMPTVLTIPDCCFHLVRVLDQLLSLQFLYLIVQMFHLMDNHINGTLQLASCLDYIVVGVVRSHGAFILTCHVMFIEHSGLLFELFQSFHHLVQSLFVIMVGHLPSLRPSLHPGTEQAVLLHPSWVGVIVTTEPSAGTVTLGGRGPIAGAGRFLTLIFLGTPEGTMGAEGADMVLGEGLYHLPSLSMDITERLFGLPVQLGRFVRATLIFTIRVLIRHRTTLPNKFRFCVFIYFSSISSPLNFHFNSLKE